MALVFDLSNPKTKRRVQAHIDRLATRTLKDIEALHVFQAKDGVYHCLDINVSESSLEALLQRVMEQLAPMPDHQVLPHAPLGLWMRMLKAPNETRKFYSGFPWRPIWVLAIARENA